MNLNIQCYLHGWYYHGVPTIIPAEHEYNNKCTYTQIKHACHICAINKAPWNISGWINHIAIIGQDINQNREHLGFFLRIVTGLRTALIASSNTVLSPFCVRAEHSTYFTAPMSFCNLSPSVVVMGVSDFSFSFCTVSLLSRRSILVPTNIIGVFGQWWITSGYH